MKIIFKITLAYCLIISSAFSSGDEENDMAHELAHMFSEGTLVTTPIIVDCTLSGGSKTRCYAFTVTGTPNDHDIGPWCPRKLSDTAEEGGIWLDKQQVHDVDGDFIKNLDTFYDDSIWQLYDEKSQEVKVTDSKEKCMAAARPDVAPEYNNYCVECQLDYMDTSTQRTYVLPINPVRTKTTKRRNRSVGAGVALNGVRLDGPAPVDAILSAHTLAPFDDCGGHINLHVGYHYHAATGCSPEVESEAEHAPVIGLAMDGYKLHAQLNKDGSEPKDLDSCRGHTSDSLDYHYHVNAAGENAILACHVAEVGCSNEGSVSTCDASKTARRGPPPGGRRGPPQKQN